MIAIIDYDAGNIRSVEKALQFLEQAAWDCSFCLNKVKRPRAPGDWAC